MGEELCFIGSYIIAGELDLSPPGVPGEIREFHDGLIGAHINKLRFGGLQKNNPEGLVSIGRTQVIPYENVVDGE